MGATIVASRVGTDFYFAVVASKGLKSPMIRFILKISAYEESHENVKTSQDLKSTLDQVLPFPNLNQASEILRIVIGW